jgi:hypothetical protein
LLQESNLGLPFDEDVISGIAWRHEPESRIRELDRHRSTADAEQ